MIFTLKVPFTRDRGAEVPITFRDGEGRILHEGPALIATGSSCCLMHGGLANRIGLRLGEPCSVTVTSDAGQTAEYSVVFERRPPGPYQADIILGMAFLAHFSVHFDGPYQVATLSSEMS